MDRPFSSAIIKHNYRGRIISEKWFGESCCFNVDLADEFQPVNVGRGTGVVAEAMKCNDDDEGGEFVSHPAGQDWTVA